jgi:hypothetical protein
MKKNISLKNDSLSKFETSEITALSTVTGGSSNVNSMTLGYTTSSSADDSDTGDHDSDSAT